MIKSSNNHTNINSIPKAHEFNGCINSSDDCEQLGTGFLILNFSERLPEFSYNFGKQVDLRTGRCSGQ